jgi:hypothetical protein
MFYFNLKIENIRTLVVSAQGASLEASKVKSDPRMARPDGVG